MSRAADREHETAVDVDAEQQLSHQIQSELERTALLASSIAHRVSHLNAPREVRASARWVP